MSDYNITIALFDYDQKRIQQISQFLADEPDIDLVAVFSDLHNVSESIKKCSELAPDVVLIDANFHLAKVTKNLVKNIPASAPVCLTIGDHFQLEQAFLPHGGRFLLDKPIQKARLIETIRHIYQQYELVRIEFGLIEKKQQIRVITVYKPSDFNQLETDLDRLFLTKNLVKRVGNFAHGRDIISKVTELEPDVIVMAFNLLDMNAIELTQKLSNVYPQAGIIVLEVAFQSEWYTELMKAGVRMIIGRPVGNSNSLYESILKIYKMYEPIRDGRLIPKWNTDGTMTWTERETDSNSKEH